MILAAHIVIAAAAAKPLIGANPLLAFLAAVLTHYIADAIPHWHYPTRTIAGKDERPLNRKWHGDRKTLAGDFLRFAADGFTGAALVFLIMRPLTSPEIWWLAAIAVGSVLPDALQGIYMAGGRSLALHQIFHHRIHSKIRLDAYPLIGIPFQAAIALIAIIFLI
jgi:hypothetical protein